MKEYEILYIIKSHLGDDVYKTIQEQLESWITKTDGEITSKKEIGMKELASELSKQKQGYYVQLQFKGTNKTLDELHSRLKVQEHIFRHMIVTLDSIQTTSPEASESPVTESPSSQETEETVRPQSETTHVQSE